MPCRSSRDAPGSSPLRVAGSRLRAALLLACAALAAPVPKAAAEEAAPPPAGHDHGPGPQAEMPHSHSHLPQGLQLFAFLSAGISHQDSTDAQDIDGQQGLVEGALLVTYGRGPFRFLAEGVLSNEEQEIERFQFGLEPAPGTTLWVGRIHQPSSYWNTEFHHGQYLQGSITRPAIEAWEDDGGVLTQHVMGVMFEQEHGLDSGTTLRVSTSVGLAPSIEDGEGLCPFELIGKDEGVRQPSYALRLDYLPDGIGEQAYGFIGGHSEIAGDRSGLLGLDHVDQTTLGLYGDVHTGDIRWLGSVYRVQNRMEYVDRHVTEYATSYYLHGEWRLDDRWMAYARHEATLGTRGSEYFSRFPGFIARRSILGARAELTARQALSLEGGAARTSTSGDFAEIRLQWSAVFH